MKQKFKEVYFRNKNINGSHFDIVNFEDILERSPKDHSQFEYHKLGFYAILIFTENTGTYNVNFKDYSFEKGSLFTVRKDNIHKFYKSKAKGVLLIFTENFILNHSNKLEASKIFLLFNETLSSPKLQLPEADYNEITGLIDFIRNEYLQINDDFSPTILSNFIQIILGKLYRIKSQDNAFFEKNKYLPQFLDFQSLVEKECFNSRKVAFFADKMGITSKTLNNVTQSIIHKSAKSFINDVIIIQAKRLITNSQDSLTEIAYQVGFIEPTNFFKYFKKYAGLSPSRFREIS